jgi:hypothetical protein
MPIGWSKSERRREHEENSLIGDGGTTSSGCCEARYRVKNMEAVYGYLRIPERLSVYRQEQNTRAQRYKLSGR